MLLVVSKMPARIGYRSTYTMQANNARSSNNAWLLKSPLPEPFLAITPCVSLVGYAPIVAAHKPADIHQTRTPDYR